MNTILQWFKIKHFVLQIFAVSALVAIAQAGLLDYASHPSSFSTAHVAAPVLSHTYAAPVVAHGYAAPAHYEDYDVS